MSEIYSEDQFCEPASWSMLQTGAAAMRQVFDKVEMIAQTPMTVLLTGETGTGKGIVARLIHERSSRKEQPFISVYCGIIPEALIESELFGHEKGAFTGAIRRKRGRFELAEGGTIFLDEISTLTATAQIKLLQVLQDRTFQPVGSEKTITTNVRVIAASNADLKEMSQKGEFRTDLFYRLNVFPIHIPALRKRGEDISLFLNFFLRKFATIHSRKITGISPDVIQACEQYDWPGNVRELENILQRAIILEKSSTLTRASFPQELFHSLSEPETLPAIPPDTSWPTLADMRRQAIEQAEQDYLRLILKESRGRINQAAQIAGVSRRQIHKLLTRYGIDKKEFKT